MGELALSQNTSVELIVVGGAAMVLVYNARESTQDVDSYIVHPKVARLARAIAASVAKELDLLSVAITIARHEIVGVA